MQALLINQCFMCGLDRSVLDTRGGMSQKKPPLPVAACGPWNYLVTQEYLRPFCALGAVLVEGGFDRHIKHDHNVWNYVYLMVSLRAKESTDFNGWEQYVWNKMEESDTSFLPRNRTVIS